MGIELTPRSEAVDRSNTAPIETSLQSMNIIRLQKTYRPTYSSIILYEEYFQMCSLYMMIVDYRHNCEIIRSQGSQGLSHWELIKNHKVLAIRTRCVFIKCLKTVLQNHSQRSSLLEHRLYSSLLKVVIGIMEYFILTILRHLSLASKCLNDMQCLVQLNVQIFADVVPLSLLFYINTSF